MASVVSSAAPSTTVVHKHILSRRPKPTNIAWARPGRIALILNANARRVSPNVIESLRGLLPKNCFYVSYSLGDARRICKDVLEQQFDTVVFGGGDGTLFQGINLLLDRVAHDAMRRRRASCGPDAGGSKHQHLPRMAVLPLGTGNALSHLLGQVDAIEGLMRLLNNLPLPMMPLQLIMGPDQTLFTFGGLGFDAMLLGDYNDLCKAFASGVQRRLSHSIVGYGAALMTKTLPRLWRNGLGLEGRIVARGTSFYVDPNQSDALVPLKENAILHDGPMSFVATATSPHFGYGLNAFPFARRLPRMMQLRVATLSPLSVLGHLPQIWRGHYRNSKELKDFIVKDVEITLKSPSMFEHSGDAHSKQSALRFHTHAPVVEFFALAFDQKF